MVTLKSQAIAFICTDYLKLHRIGTELLQQVEPWLLCCQQVLSIARIGLYTVCSISKAQCNPCLDEEGHSRQLSR